MGEALHPGPAGSRATERKRQERGSADMADVTPNNFAAFGLLDSLKPMLQQLLEKLVRDMLSQFLGSSPAGVAAALLKAGSPSKAKPKKKRSKKQKPSASPAILANKSAASTSAATKPAVVKPVNQQPPAKTDAQKNVPKKVTATKPSVNANDGEWVTIDRQKTPSKWTLRGQDWDSEVLVFDNLAQTIQSQGDNLRGVVLVPDGEQKIVVENMLAGHGHKFALLMIVPGKIADSTPTRVPGLCGNRVSFMYVCMYVCMHVCMHACMYVCMHGWMHGCMDAWMHGCMHACMHACMYACMDACMYACMHVCMYACMHVCMYACMRVCMHVCTDACMYACMHTCMYVCMSACTHACVHICIYACMHVGTYVRTYVRT